LFETFFPAALYFMLCLSASGLDIFTVWFLVEWLYQYLDLEQAYFLFYRHVWYWFRGPIVCLMV